LTLADLANFLAHPAKEFSRRRLGARFGLYDTTVEDHEPFELNSLEQWLQRDALVRQGQEALLAGQVLSEVQAHIIGELEKAQLSGALPAYAQGKLIAEALAGPVFELLERLPDVIENYPFSVPVQPVSLTVKVSLQAGNSETLSLQDRIGDLRCNEEGKRVRWVLSVSKLVENKTIRFDKLISPWVQHLACQLGGEVTTQLFYPEGEIRLSPLSADQARAQLENYLLLWHEGMQWPLPFAVKTATAWCAVMEEAGEIAAESVSDDVPNRETGEAEKNTVQEARKTDTENASTQEGDIQSASSQEVPRVERRATAALAVNEYADAIAASVYEEGGYQQEAERRKEPELARWYPDYQTLKEAHKDLPLQSGFADLVDKILVPLMGCAWVVPKIRGGKQ
jgi:exonuclease V gamma subunit